MCGVRWREIKGTKKAEPREKRKERKRKKKQ
jgi:hypothetical protein